MLKQLVTMIQDGEGNTSAMRVVVVLVVVCVMVPPAIAAIRSGGTVQWSQSDVELIAAVIAGKVGQGFFEGKAPVTPTAPTTPKV